MRLLTTLNDSGKAFALSQYLEKGLIENIVDITTDSDWGSDKYGESLYKIWVFEEDLFQKAQELQQEFNEKGITAPDPILPRPQIIEPPIRETIYLKPDLPEKQIHSYPLGQVVRLLLFLCLSLFFIQTLEYADIQKLISNDSESINSETFLFASPIYQELLYDFPKKYQVAEQLLRLPEGDAQKEALFQQFQKTVAWPGLYDILLSKSKSETPSLSEYPLFEKISEGQLWRLVTPIFLHGNLLHLLFNIFWVIILGRQIESIVGREKMALLVVLAAVVSNTSQYLMSGPDFIGISAVVSAFVFFIGERMRIAPSEPYQLERPTYLFLLAYIFGLALIQLIFFALNMGGIAEFSLGVANTAHLSGGLIGWILGRLPFYKEKST